MNNCADNSFSGNSSVRHDLIADVEAKAFPNNNVPAWSIPLVQHLLDRLGALVDNMRGSLGIVFSDYINTMFLTFSLLATFLSQAFVQMSITS